MAEPAGRSGPASPDYQALMAAIGWGRARPGERVDAPAVASTTGIDPERLRGLMEALKQDGLAEDVGGETRVLITTEEALRELLELRVLIEVPLACEAAERGADPDDVRVLLSHAERCRAAAAIDDELAYIRWDLAFHLHLTGLAGDREAVELVRLLRIRSRIGAMPAAAHGPFMRLNADEHVEIAEAVQDSRPNVVDTVLRRHISRIRDEWFDVRRGGEEDA